MERLTNSGTKEAKSNTTIIEICDKLSDYEDLEELIGIPLKELAEIFRQHIPDDCKYPQKVTVLTDDDVDKWREYKGFHGLHPAQHTRFKPCRRQHDKLARRRKLCVRVLYTLRLPGQPPYPAFLEILRVYRLSDRAYHPHFAAARKDKYTDNHVYLCRAYRQILRYSVQDHRYPDHHDAQLLRHAFCDRKAMKVKSAPTCVGADLISKLIRFT